MQGLTAVLTPICFPPQRGFFEHLPLMLQTLSAEQTGGRWGRWIQWCEPSPWLWGQLEHCHHTPTAAPCTKQSSPAAGRATAWADQAGKAQEKGCSYSLPDISSASSAGNLQICHYISELCCRKDKKGSRAHHAVRQSLSTHPAQNNRALDKSPCSSSTQLFDVYHQIKKK